MELRGRKHDYSSHLLLLEPTKNEPNTRLVISSCMEDRRSVSSSSNGDENYLNRPTVYSKLAVDQKLSVPGETHRSSNGSSLKNKAESIAGCHEEANDKIQKALKDLNLPEPCYLVQFCSLYSVGKHNKFLKTMNQPFGLGICDEGLCSYRRESEHNWFPVDGKCQEQDLIPVVRVCVFKRQLPEWTSDVTIGYSKKHPLQECAICFNLHGYLVLPVFDSCTMSCVGVLDFITSSKYFDFSYEVQKIHRSLQESNLTSPRASDFPTSHVNHRTIQLELDEIFRILKDVCDAHKLPLAQTWTVSMRSSFVATGRNIEMTCSSLNSNCVGKICRSTTALPFYVHDLRFWSFREACRDHHFLNSEGVVGRALSSHGLCFREIVTKLDEHEYSLVHHAHMSGLTSCFAIYLHSIEHDVFEFFLPVDMKEGADLHNLVLKVKMHVKLSSFELGDLSSTEVTGMQTGVSQLSLEMRQLSLGMQLDSLTVGETYARIDCINAQDQSDSSNQKNWINAITNTLEMTPVHDVTTMEFDVVTKQRRKQKMDSVTLETIQQYFGKLIGEASKRLGVSRSTLKRVCQKLNIPTWPLPRRKKKYVHISIYVIVLLLVRVKRWSCSSNRHGFSAKWWICGKHNAFVSDSELSIEAYGSSRISKPLTITGKNIREQLSLPQTLKESDHSIKIANPNPTQASLDMLPASPKKKLAKVLDDTMMLTVKAAFKNDMIKFQFPLSSGLLELKRQVARRFKLKKTRLHLKYRDEDNDLILIACETDLSNLMPFSVSSVSKTTIKLIVEMGNG